MHCPQCQQPAKPQLLREEHNNPYNQYAVSKLPEKKQRWGSAGCTVFRLWHSVIRSLRGHVSLCTTATLECAGSFSVRPYATCPSLFMRTARDSRLRARAGCGRRQHAALERDEVNFQMFNVGSGKAMSVLAYAHAVLKKLSSRMTVEMSGEYRREDNRHSDSSVEKLRRLGWQPRRPLSVVLDDSSNGSRASAEYSNKSRTLTLICEMPAWC